MNTNPNAKRILCFGDSNTWGYIPGTKQNRYPSDIRWTGVLQDILGNEYEVVEEGLNSRGIVEGDLRPGKEGRSAMEYIIPCLDSHDPLDYVIVFLGTNELKAELNLSVEQIGENLRKIISVIQNRPSQFRETKPQVMIIVPPAVDETTAYASKDDKYKGAYQKSLGFTDIYSKIAEEAGSMLIKMQPQLMTGEDGIHLLSESHKGLAVNIASLIRR